MIAIIDYGMSNLYSISGMLDKIGVKHSLVSSSNELEESQCEALILPGVGSFPKAINNLKSRKLYDPIKELVEVRKLPILGICLGFQLMHKKSSEMGETSGFGWLDAEIVKFNDNLDVTIPHIGWNEVNFSNTEPLFKGLKSPNLFYFVHSYHSTFSTDSTQYGKTQYGYSFCSAASVGNIHGCQFHPEKSQQSGLRYLTNFIELCCVKE